MHRELTFSDFLEEMTQFTHLAPISPCLARRLGLPAVDVAQLEATLRRARAIGCSMTQWERDHPQQLDARRRRRIAMGAGVGILEVSRLIRQFELTHQVMHRGGATQWRNRLGAVLGLVTDDPWIRDPSYVSPHPDDKAWRSLRLAIAVAVCAVAILTFFAFWHG